MDAPSTPYSGLLAFAAGVASHLFYFRIGEHHMLPIVYIQLFVILNIASAAALVTSQGLSFSSAVAAVSSLSALWLLGVYTSLVTYRLFFHPLRNFPGPWQARIGDLWFSTRLSKGDGHVQLTDFHRRYGRYVRIGSNSLSITDPEMMQAAYGPNSKVVKSDWYDGAYPYHSMQTTRDKGLHDRRRRVWAPAFSDKALREYEMTVVEFNDKFVKKIEEQEGRTIDIRTMFNLYSFDVMGRLAFGKDYGMLESGKRHWALDLLVEGLEVGIFRFPTWVNRTLRSIPGAATGYYKFLKFCSDELRKRVQDGGKETNNKDITSWLLKAYAGEKHPEEDAMLQGDSRLIIVAGSDTTSATLTHLFYYLAIGPAQQAKLRQEIKSLVKETVIDKDIQHADRLNGAINEALRLHPAVPSGVARKTPNEGVRVGDTFIPGNVTFYTPQYSMGRDADVYPEPFSFVPERWYSKPEMVKHPDAFAPFSMGSFNCIGRNLARMELRTLTAQILLNYEVALAPGEDGTRLLTQTMDHFTTSPGQLDLVFTPVPV
ncbi:Tryprostatin B 6-hydroxylase [Lecanosticta acicola]|uniref:Tryprostatin B 6-hydroxylase n=1 Tax=Lecanosticta acicola TaxID=111012 RepID=A0AAI8YRH5_9PEZI|nr:Tryprostatin B 6-hydroxylase [Lecanosticta acicola]